MDSGIERGIVEILVHEGGADGCLRDREGVSALSLDELDHRYPCLHL